MRRCRYTPILDKRGRNALICEFRKSLKKGDPGQKATGSCTSVTAEISPGITLQWLQTFFKKKMAVSFLMPYKKHWISGFFQSASTSSVEIYFVSFSSWFWFYRRFAVWSVQLPTAAAGSCLKPQCTTEQRGGKVNNQLLRKLKHLAANQTYFSQRMVETKQEIKGVWILGR